MTVEQLIFCIPSNLQATFIQLDELVWTPYLSQFEFFVSKEIWQDAHNPELLSIVIHWQSLEEWKSIPITELTELNNQFNQLSLSELGQIFLIKESRTYNVASID